MRKPRLLIQDGMYHVVSRANRREFILDSDEIKMMFLDVVKQAKDKFHFSLINFCIMSNHFHFMIKPRRGENLSRIMQWILSVFALRFNKRFGLVGHVWYDRFKSKIVDGMNEFLHTFRYISENPLRAGLARYPWEHCFNGVAFLRNLDYRIIEKPEMALSMLEPTLCGPILLS